MTISPSLPPFASGFSSLIYFRYLKARSPREKVAWVSLGALAIYCLSLRQKGPGNSWRKFVEIAAPFFLVGAFEKAAWKTNVVSAVLLGMGRLAFEGLFHHFQCGNSEKAPFEAIAKPPISSLEQRASQGDTDAQVDLGIRHASKMICIDDYEALKWFRLAALKSERAQFYLAVMIHNGRGCSPNRGEAIKWLKRAAEQGYKTAIAHLKLWEKGLSPSSFRCHPSSLFLLDLAEMEIDRTAFQNLLNALPQLPVQFLQLKGNRIGDGECALLSEVLPKTGIEVLDLWHNLIGDRGISSLAPILPKTKLQVLDLAENQIGDEGASCLAHHLPESEIHTLHLGENQIQQRGCFAIAKCLPKTSLRVLDIGRNPLGEEGVRELFRTLSQTQLEILDIAETLQKRTGPIFSDLDLTHTSLQAIDLKQNLIQDRDIEDLCKTLSFSKIRDLNLRNNQIGPKGGAELIRHLPLDTHIVNLRGNQIGDEGAIEIAKGLHKISHLLNLSGNQIGPKGAAALFSALPEARIDSLNLGGNQVGKEFPFESGPPGKNLRSLHLAGNGLFDEGCVSFAKWVVSTSLQELFLEGNQIGDRGFIELCGKFPPSLKVLNLSGNQISEKGIAYFESPIKNLEQVDFQKNRLGNRGVEALAPKLRGSRVMKLNLASNGFDEKGLEALCRILPDTVIETLDLSHNPIKDEGVAQLGAILSQTAIHTLNLSHCSITNRGAEKLKSVLGRTSIHTLDMEGNPISATVLLSGKKKKTDPSKRVTFQQDFSPVVAESFTLEDLISAAKEELQELYSFVDTIELLSDTPYESLTEKVRQRLGMDPGEKNLLFRIHFKQNGKTLTKEETFQMGKRVFDKIHRKNGS